MTKKSINTIFFICAALLVIIDQVTKLAVKGLPSSGSGLGLGESIPVLGDFLQITYVENEGMAFGISFGIFKIVLSLFSIIASSALAYYLYKLRNFSVWIQMGVALILAGALGNLIDRVFYAALYGYGPIFYGKVVDFIQVDIPDINILGFHYSHWPVFNVADSCVTVGVVVLILFHKRLPAFNKVFERNTEKPASSTDRPDFNFSSTENEF